MANTKHPIRNQGTPLAQELEAHAYAAQVFFMEAPALIAVLHGPEGRVDSVNPRFLNLWGGRKIIGKTMRDAWPETEWQGLYNLAKKVMKSGKTAYAKEYPGAIDRHNNGHTEQIYCNFVLQPYKDDSGKTTGATLYGVDVTDQVIARQNAIRSQEQLEQALEASGTGVWEWQVPTNTLIWSNELKKLFGVPPETEMTYEYYMELLHPEDRKMMQNVISDARLNGKPYQVEHRVIWPDGSVHWLLGRGKAYLQDGEVVRMTGITMNIDDVKRALQRKHELEAITATLTRQRRQLLALNNAKDEFISIASHQLRTPATAVKQYVGMLLQGYVGKVSPMQIKMLQAAYDSNERQLNIVEDLLRVAHVDSGKVRLSKSTTDLGRLMDEVILDQMGKIIDRSQKLSFTKPPTPVTAHVDNKLIRMVLENIIDNASKYTPIGESITITVHKLRGLAQLKVKDTGVGIDKKDQKKLFQKFSRVDNPLSTTVTGSGLGLYWAKHIVDLHGGDIELDSEVGKGSVFTISLPTA